MNIHEKIDSLRTTEAVLRGLGWTAVGLATEIGAMSIVLNTDKPTSIAVAIAVGTGGLYAIHTAGVAERQANLNEAEALARDRQQTPQVPPAV